MRNIVLEKSTGECLHDFEVGKDFLSSIQKALNPVGKKKDKSDYIKKFYSRDCNFAFYFVPFSIV